MKKMYTWLAFMAWVLVGVILTVILFLQIAFIAMDGKVNSLDLVFIMTLGISIFIWSTLIEIRWGAR